MTILEELQAKYPDAPGINDARNIAEALACISGMGGRGANAIADYLDDDLVPEEHIEPGGPRDYGSVGDQTFYAGWVDEE